MKPTPDDFKPHEYDPVFGIDVDTAVSALLEKRGVTSVDQLPLSAFSNYTASKDTLNEHQQLIGASQFIGNDLIYVSGGSTPGSYTTGTLVTPENPARNLLNINNPTVNNIPHAERLTEEQIGRFFLPKHTTPLTYASFSHKHVILTEKISPGQVYVLADPTIYGSGFGAGVNEADNPVDHVEDLSWIQSPPVIVGAQGRIRGSVKMPLYNGYTSTEQTIGAPQFGVSRYTDNFDFWAGSPTGDIWANADIYPLEEANKYDLIARGSDLLSDFCDIPYKNKTDVYGNHYVMFKLGTEDPKNPAGGSDTDGDGIDDDIRSGLGTPDYYGDDGGVEPVFTETGTAGGGNGLGNTGLDTGGSIDDGDRQVDETGETTDGGNSYFDYEFSDETGDVNVTTCNYWLNGGGSFSDSVSAVKLDTDGGGITTIIDGGWRVWDPGDDPSANQVDVTPTGALNGFYDDAAHAADSTGFNAVTDTASWFPNYAYVAVGNNEAEPLEDYRSFPRVSVLPDNCISPDKCNYTVSFGTNGDTAYRVTTNRDENVEDHRMIVADGGWYQNGSSPTTAGATFKRQQCDRQSYVLTLYDNEEPDFGNNIFACKMYRITLNARSYVGSSTARTWYSNRYNTPPGEVSPQWVQDYAYAKWRGPLNFTKHYNPIDYRVNGIPTINYAGTKAQLQADGMSDILFDYLTEYEAFLMRISPIEGSGSWAIDGDTTTHSFFDETSHAQGTRAGIYGHPDLLYYKHQGTFTDGTEYSQVSGSLSWIRPESFTDDQIVLDDMYGQLARDTRKVGGGKATQFPQIPWDISNQSGANNRDLSIPLDGNNVTYYLGLNCNNVCEYQFFDSVLLMCDERNNTRAKTELTLNRQVNSTHPMITERGTVYRSKRGYFPPPVGHLRRQQTHPLGVGGQLGEDKPILDNFLSETDRGDGSDGFLVHDVWDAGGFGARPGLIDTEFVEPAPIGPPDAPPPEIPVPVIPGPDTPEAGCGVFTEPNQIGWRTEVVNGETKCFPVTGDGGPGVGIVLPPGTGTGPGTSVVISCGSYSRYDVTIVNQVQNPCPATAEASTVPFDHIAQLVKRSSDSGDSCVVTPAQSLWVQKHQPVMSDPSQPLNLFYRNAPGNKIGTIDELFPGLVDTATQYDISFDNSFTDFDIVHDIVMLRQQTSTDDVWLFDQITYDFDTDTTTSGDRNTHLVTAALSSTAQQLLSPFYNEETNTILVGKTDGVGQYLLPVLDELDLNTQQWKRVFPVSGEHDNILTNFEIPAPYVLESLDPGEISFNPETDHYTITYIGRLDDQNTGEPPLLTIFNTKLFMKNGIVELKSVDFYITADFSSAGVQQQEQMLQYEERPVEDTIQAQNSEFAFTLKLQNLVGTSSTLSKELDLLYVDIDWGDGETSTLWSQFESSNLKGSFQRYGGSTVNGQSATILSDKTVIYTGEHPDGAAAVSDASVSNHRVTHTYKTIENEVYNVLITAYYNDNTTIYRKQFKIQSNVYSIENTIDDIKLLSTKLFTPVREVNTLATQTLPLWTPELDPDTNVDLAVWLDASSTTSLTLDVSGNVETWKDTRDTSSYAISNATPTRRPTSGSHTLNGLNVLDWGLDENSRGLITNTPNPATWYDVYIVARYDGDLTRAGDMSGIVGLLGGSNNSSNDDIGVITDLPGGDPLDLYGIHWWDKLYINSVESDGSYVLPTMQTGFVLSASTPSPNQAGLCVGTDRGIGNRGWRGVIAEVVIFNRVLSPELREKMEGYLAHKWGVAYSLPDTHEYKHQAPTYISINDTRLTTELQKKEQLMLTLETQSPRYVVHNVIDM